MSEVNNLAKYPHQIGDRVATFLREGDLDGIISMFHPECQIHFPLGEQPKVGHEGVRAVFSDFVELRPVLVSNVKRETINGDIAVLQAEWRFEQPDGTLIMEGESTEVAKRLENGGWGYFIDCPLGIPTL